MRRIFYSLCIILVMGAVSAVCAGIYALDYYAAPGPLTTQTNIIFERGKGFAAIADTMAAQGVIEHPLLFKGLAALFGQGRNFKAGEYSFAPGTSPQTAMQMLAQGKVVIHKVVVPEGLSVRDILKIIASEPSLEGDIPADIREGSLMPETYHFTRGEKRSAVIARMQTAMKNTLDGLWPARQQGLPVTTPEQALILASIVEKETGVPQERGQVASAFINRLRIGMRLQSDPTVVYGMEKVMGGPLGRPLTTADLQTPTEYNTYVITGLPPGPIANPGRASLEAVLNPPDTKFLYFVATGTGGHNFASSLEEHNRNVALYRQRMAAR